MALSLTGCGISLGTSDSSELFEEIRVLGEPRVGQEMRLEVTYGQRYPVAVTISCFLERPGHSLRLLGRDIVAPSPDTSAEPEPVEGRSAFRFRPDLPGRYKAYCNTPLDFENQIETEFRVR